MPTPGSLEAEDSAVDALLEHLHRNGHTARFVARPDRERGHALTVDAIVDIDGTPWAIGVCDALMSPRRRTASDRAESILRPPLEVRSLPRTDAVSDA